MTTSDSDLRAAKGNFVAEWFGHRVYPLVADTPEAHDDQTAARCPFLTTALDEETVCVKSENSRGVCTISSPSNGERQDWLVCPYRVHGSNLLDEVVARFFATPAVDSPRSFSAPSLEKAEVRAEFDATLLADGFAVVYFQNKLGGEISVSATERSPEFSFDVTMVSVTRADGKFVLGKYGIFEIQTMDFHGSYKHAVTKLRAALDLHGQQFADQVAQHPEWPGEKIEGPNIGNVFKRTFYQTVFKFEMGAAEHAAGVVLAIPKSVWDSWQPYLAAPTLVDLGDTTWRLGEEAEVAGTDAWLYIFDIDESATTSPNEIKVWRMIRSSAEALSRHALHLSPEYALAEGGATDRVLTRIHTRLSFLLAPLAPL